MIERLMLPAPALQRNCSCAGGDQCEECKSKGAMQRQTVPAAVHETLREGGSPLDSSTRAFMEGRFGHDFSRVRIHTSERASESAAAVHANAYTLGSDIAFRRGLYSPGTSGGRKLLAHELAHVVQQDSRLPISAGIDGGPADPFEISADAMANAALSAEGDKHVQS